MCLCVEVVAKRAWEGVSAKLPVLMVIEVELVCFFRNVFLMS